MTKLKLQTKQEKPSESKMTVRRIASKLGYVPQHDPENYPLLKDNRYVDEKFSRIDRFWVNHYYLIGAEWLCEKIFYPSSYGFELIESENLNFKELCDRLINDGIGLWGERPVPNIKKPVERIKLECKSENTKRMRLECKE